MISAMSSASAAPSRAALGTKKPQPQFAAKTTTTTIESNNPKRTFWGTLLTLLGILPPGATVITNAPSLTTGIAGVLAAVAATYGAKMLATTLSVKKVEKETPDQ